MRSSMPKKTIILYICLGLILISSLGVAAYFLYLKRLERNILQEAKQIQQEVLSSPSSKHDVAESQEEQAPEFSAAPHEIDPMWQKLRAEFGNDDIIGRLFIEGTSIDYLVVQGNDNDFYLHHDIWRNESSAGWVFLDYMVDLESEDHDIVIYGHNMKSDNMFHALRYYADYDFFRQHPTISFNTIYGDYEWEVFAFFTAHISFPYTYITYPNYATRAHMLDRFMEASIYDTGVTVTQNDRILTLSTCTNDDPDERLVLQARLVPFKSRP